MKLNVLIVLLCSSLIVNAQFVDEFNRNQNRRQNEKHFSEQRNWGDAIWSPNASMHRPIGWFINPGITYMMGNSADDKNRAYDLTPSGLPGYFIEAGMEHLFPKAKKVVHYVDWGLGIKHFGGQEKYSVEGVEPTRGQFNFGSAFAHAGIHNVWQLNLYNFIDQSIGFNLDYRIYGGKDDENYLSPLAAENQGKLLVQLHYTLGFGYKVEDGFFIVPTIQTPIFTAVSFDGFNPSHHWFSSRYQPLIFTIKFGWLFPKKGCTPVEKSEGVNEDKI